MIFVSLKGSSDIEYERHAEHGMVAVYMPSLIYPIINLATGTNLVFYLLDYLRCQCRNRCSYCCGLC